MSATKHGSHEPQHHIGLSAEDLSGNGGLGRYVFLPGDLSRAGRIAAGFRDLEVVENPRGFTAHLGWLEGREAGSRVDVLAIPTGIGSASVEVVVHELIAAGARRFVRVGSCGTSQPEIRPGQVVIATAAVRDERTTADYAPPEFPAAAHPEAVAAMVEGARYAGLGGETFCGVCHSKASLYAREFGHGPSGQRNLDYVERLRHCGVVASEMECSALFVLSAVAGGPPVPVAGSSLAGGNAAGCRATAVLAVYATDDSNMELDPVVAKQAESRAIRVAVEGVRVWAERDLAGSA